MKVSQIVELIGIVSVSLLVPLLFKTPNIYCPYWQDVGFSFMYTTTLWLGNGAIFRVVNRKFTEYKDYVKKLILQTSFMLSYTLTMIVLLGVLIQVVIHNREIDMMILGESMKTALLVTVLVSMIYESGFLLNRWKRTIVEAERLKKQQIQSQLEALKNQISPHFLFNSLNSLASLVHEDAKTADKFIQELAKVYRYVLDQQHKELVPLKSELEFVDSYLFLHSIRFGENLHTDIKVDSRAEDVMVIPLALQMLIENAVKHNVISEDKPLTIRIYRNESHLTIENNIQRKRSTEPGAGVGHDNIVERYKFFTDDEVLIEETSDIFRVSIPIIKSKK